MYTLTWIVCWILSSVCFHFQSLCLIYFVEYFRICASLERGQDHWRGDICSSWLIGSASQGNASLREGWFRDLERSFDEATLEKINSRKTKFGSPVTINLWFLAVVWKSGHHGMVEWSLAKWRFCKVYGICVSKHYPPRSESCEYFPYFCILNSSWRPSLSLSVAAVALVYMSSNNMPLSLNWKNLINLIHHCKLTTFIHNPHFGSRIS